MENYFDNPIYRFTFVVQYSIIHLLTTKSSIMELTGKIIFINPTVTPGAAKPDFQVRNFGIETVTEINFQPKIDVWGFQTTKPSQLDGLGIGDEIKVTFGIRCTKKENTALAALPQNPTNISIFSSLDCYKIEVITRSAQHAAAPASTTQAQPALIPQPDGPVPEGKQLDAVIGQWIDEVPF